MSCWQYILLRPDMRARDSGRGKSVSDAGCGIICLCTSLPGETGSSGPHKQRPQLNLILSTPQAGRVSLEGKLCPTRQPAVRLIALCLLNAHLLDQVGEPAI